MRLKSFFAESVEAALANARRELGSEAMLVNSQRTTAEFRHLGDYEVVCAVMPDREGDSSLRPKSSPSRANPVSELEKLTSEVSELRIQMARLVSSMSHTGVNGAEMPVHPALHPILTGLREAEIAPEIANEIIERAQAAETGSSASPSWPDLVQAEVRRLIRADSSLGKSGFRNSLIAMVGPPGSGKTTSLVKLAVRYYIAKRKPCHIMTLDTVRIAAVEQLRSLSAIIGVPFHVIETPELLAEALASLRSGETAFIDTPGFGRFEMAQADAFSQALNAADGLDVHLVLPASMRASDMRRVAREYEVFSPSKLLFTRSDETESFGSILNLSYWAGKPVSFLGTGQQVPEDLESADQDTLAQRVLKGVFGDSASDAVAA